MPTYSDSEIKQIVTDYIKGSDHPDLLVYARDFDTKFDFRRWLASMRSHCELGNFYGKRILEVGCGFGWDAVGLSLVGNNDVVATDILPSMIDGVKECLATQESKGRHLNVTPLQGDICDLDQPLSSFDGIFSSEAVEHVHNLEAMFDQCFQLLKSGGRLVIYNDSNRYNTEFREATFEMWKQRDTSWDHAKWLEAEIRPVEHKGAMPYAAMREAIILECEVTLDPESRAILVAATAGLTRPEIVTATKTFEIDQKLPTPPRFSWCRNPETGEYAERLLDPFEMAGWLRNSGFKNVKLRHAFSKFPFTLLNSVKFRPLNLWLFDKRPMFLLIADKF